MKILVFYSGGKDSQACLILACKKYGVQNCEAVFCDTGWENPMTYEHIKTTTEQLGVKLVVLKSKKYNGMIDMATKLTRWPSSQRRFCTQLLKAYPAIDYVLSLNENVIVIEGIRAQESFSRSKMEAQCTYFKYYFEFRKTKTDSYRKKDVLAWCKEFNADKSRPIFDWSAEQTLNYILDNGQFPNPLYYMGFARVGCFPCIMSRHKSTKLIIENHPEQWNKLVEAEKLLESSFFPPDYIPKHACSMISKNGKRFPSAQDVEKYLKGKDATIDMFENETPSCMSTYNLCE